MNTLYHMDGIPNHTHFIVRITAILTFTTIYVGVLLLDGWTQPWAVAIFLLGCLLADTISSLITTACVGNLKLVQRISPSSQRAVTNRDESGIDFKQHYRSTASQRLGNIDNGSTSTRLLAVVDECDRQLEAENFQEHARQVLSRADDYLQGSISNLTNGPGSKPNYLQFLENHGSSPVSPDGSELWNGHSEYHGTGRRSASRYNRRFQPNTRSSQQSKPIRPKSKLANEIEPQHPTSAGSQLQLDPWLSCVESNAEEQKDSHMEQHNQAFQNHSYQEKEAPSSPRATQLQDQSIEEAILLPEPRRVYRKSIERIEGNAATEIQASAESGNLGEDSVPPYGITKEPLSLVTSSSSDGSPSKQSPKEPQNVVSDRLGFNFRDANDLRPGTPRALEEIGAAIWPGWEQPDPTERNSLSSSKAQKLHRLTPSFI